MKKSQAIQDLEDKVLSKIQSSKEKQRASQSPDSRPSITSENNEEERQIMTLKESIIESAKEVYAELGRGYLESVYHEAMCVEFNSRGIKYEFKQSVLVYYKGHKVGLHYIDFLIKDEKESIIVELKATSARTTTKDKAQLRSYIHTLGFESGLMINFFHDHPSDPIIDEVLLNQ